MGLFKQPPRKYAWNERGGCLRGTPVSKNRFEQILKYIHFQDRGISPPQNRPWWTKLEFVLSDLRIKCQKYWIPGPFLTVDEIMIHFEGRSTQKVSIPGKPIPCGFKLFGLSDGGYLFNWEATRPGENEGAILDGSKYSVTIPGIIKKTFLSATQAVVVRLAKSLLRLAEEGQSFHLYLDNLFVSWKLCYYLLQRGIAVTGTVRKGAAGFPPRLLALKAVNTALKWGSIQASILIGNVLAFVWQDNNLVMGIFISLLLLRLY
jgi:hypothetical protein